MTTTVINIRDLDRFMQGIIKGGGDSRYVYIGRPSKWGNPYVMSEGALTREECVEEYRNDAMTGWPPFDDLSELKDKVLVCWCKPLPCHGDVLAELADL